MEKDQVLLAHGSGGKLSHQLVEKIFLPAFENPLLARMDDQASFEIGDCRLAFSTDSFVVNPIFFPGGDIGKLAVCGTVNDLAVGGAKPLFLSAAFMIEEGLPFEILEKIIASMRLAARESGVSIITGDTKVVEKGSVDKIFINTSGIGIIEKGIEISGNRARPGDKVIINGYIGDHGLAVMAERQGLSFRQEIKSDCAPLNHLIAGVLDATKDVHVMRDPTRGGIATTLNEIACQSEICISLDENALPIRDEVRAACEILGYDPLYVANEGKVLVIVPGNEAERVLEAMKKDKYGKDAVIIGEVLPSPRKKVVLNTSIGGKRIIDMLAGDQLPRIC